MPPASRVPQLWQPGADPGAQAPAYTPWSTRSRSGPGRDPLGVPAARGHTGPPGWSDRASICWTSPIIASAGEPLPAAPQQRIGTAYSARFPAVELSRCRRLKLFVQPSRPLSQQLGTGRILGADGDDHTPTVPALRLNQRDRVG